VEDGKFVVLTHPDAVYDLEGDSNITNLWINGGAGGKQGQIFDLTFKDLPLGFRLYESSIVPISRASGYGDVYNTWVLGKGYFGTLKIDNMPAKVIVKEPGSAGTADPLDQVATVGWKANFAAVILDQSRGVLILHQTSNYTGTRAGL
jgi:N4-gp56 family major capsid protein